VTRPPRSFPATLLALAALAGGLVAALPAAAGTSPTAGVVPAVTAETAAASGDALYDPKADTEADLARAIEQARASHRRILLEVGGNWCIWCHRLHDFVESHEQVREAWNRGFVTVNVNFSKENENRKFLRHYPRIPGYPHLFVLDSSGKLLHSENTGLLEHGEGYSEKAILEFLKRWSPPAETGV
jgi:thiol:disulfide interchange protein